MWNVALKVHVWEKKYTPSTVQKVSCEARASSVKQTPGTLVLGAGVEYCTYSVYVSTRSTSTPVLRVLHISKWLHLNVVLPEPASKK